MKDTSRKHPRRNTLGKRKVIFLSITGLVLVLIDQLLKNYFVRNSHYFNLVSFHLVQNTGASFGFLQGRIVLMIIVSFIFLGLLWLIRDEFKNCSLCLLFLAAGTVGNLIDRLFLGYVIDFVDLGWFPVFNFSDVLITLGTIGLVWMFIREMTSKKNRIKE